MDNRRLLQHQYLSKGLYFNPGLYLQLGYALELAKSYAPYALFNINTDVRTPANVDLTAYRIISLPLSQMAGPDFIKRLDQWVREEGTLVLGWRKDTKDRDNRSAYSDLPGLFAEMAG